MLESWQYQVSQWYIFKASSSHLEQHRDIKRQWFSVMFLFILFVMQTVCRGSGLSLSETTLREPLVRKKSTERFRSRFLSSFSTPLQTFSWEGDSYWFVKHILLRFIFHCCCKSWIALWAPACNWQSKTECKMKSPYNNLIMAS